MKIKICIDDFLKIMKKWKKSFDQITIFSQEGEVGSGKGRVVRRENEKLFEKNRKKGLTNEKECDIIHRSHGEMAELV